MGELGRSDGAEQASFISKAADLGHWTIDRIKRIANSRTAMLAAAGVAIGGVGDAVIASASSADVSPEVSLLNNTQTQRNNAVYSRNGRTCRINCDMFGLNQSIEVKDVTLKQEDGTNYIDVDYIDELGSASLLPMELTSIEVLPDKRQTVTYVHTPITQAPQPGLRHQAVKNAKSYSYPKYYFGRERTFPDPAETLFPGEPMDIDVHTLIREKPGSESTLIDQADALRLIAKGQPQSTGYEGNIFNRITTVTHIETQG
jgi:hypothetical protein